MALLDDVLPEFDVRERHARCLDAPPERVFAALREVTLAEMPVAAALVRLRGTRSAARRPLLEDMQRAFAVLAEKPGRELVLGAVGQPWRWRGGSGARGATRAEAFRAFSDPGYAKMAIDFRYDGAVLSTETRVLLTSAGARRRFRPYWLAIRPFSGLIRRLLLRAVERRVAAGA